MQNDGSGAETDNSTEYYYESFMHVVSAVTQLMVATSGHDVASNSVAIKRQIKV